MTSGGRRKSNRQLVLVQVPSVGEPRSASLVEHVVPGIADGRG